MDKIKSIYIIKYIFSFLKNNSFLSIISYSKKFQSKLNITLNDYKLATNYYIIKENDITKIYRKDINMLIFKGKYEKGKKIEGKEYKSNTVIFKGKYNKGICWSGQFFNPRNYNKKLPILEMGFGPILNYNLEGFLQFNGEYKDGMKSSGIEYNKNGKKIFEGEYKNNLRWNGKFYSPDQTKVFLIEEGNGNIEEYNTKKELIFKGELKNGYRFCGFGKEYYKENGNLKLDVEYKNFNYIKGYYYNIKGFKEFEGKFKEEKKFEGILYQEKDMDNYSLFYGELNKGKKYKGIEIKSNSAYIGEFDDEEKYLKGKYYDGFFDINKKMDLFKKNNLKEINIEEIEKNGDLIFIGEFQNQQFYKGKEYKYNQITFEGEYKNNIYFNGKGYQIIDKFNNKKEGFEGIYINGEKQGKEITYDEEGNPLMEKIYKDKNNWKYIFHDYRNNKVFYGEVIDGNSDIVMDYKIYLYKNEFIEKKVYKYFIGSYKDNERYIGKEYDEYDNIKFEGEFKEGKYYYGKEYYDIYIYTNNNERYLKFEGQLKNGKYYKGKEYYNPCDYKEDFDNNFQEVDFNFKKFNVINFKGIYKEGKKYIGWEYNLFSNLIFVGEYNSGLYWHGYFYEPGDLYKQKKCGFIKNGNGKNIKLYDIYGSLEFTGEFINGERKYYYDYSYDSDSF